MEDMNLYNLKRFRLLLYIALLTKFGFYSWTSCRVFCEKKRKTKGTKFDAWAKTNIENLSAMIPANSEDSIIPKFNIYFPLFLVKILTL